MFRHRSEVQGTVTEIFTDEPFLSAGDPDLSYQVSMMTIVTDMLGTEATFQYFVTVNL